MAGHIASSKSVHWCTPKPILDKLELLWTAHGGIALDPCSNAGSLVPASVAYALPAHDGLKGSWDFKTIFVNPPYGRDKARKTSIFDWVKKCADAHRDHGSEVVCLIPAAVDTKHWQQVIFKSARAVCFIKGRVKFVGAKAHAPMACALCYWGPGAGDFQQLFSDVGQVLDLYQGVK